MQADSTATKKDGDINYTAIRYEVLLWEVEALTALDRTAESIVLEVAHRKCKPPSIIR
ncbi:MAG: hypothetical protein IPF93_08540 [Saprospiraceae bacterium]|nr:hypothetical protein [Saprospiraceae bacterium]